MRQIVEHNGQLIEMSPDGYSFQVLGDAQKLKEMLVPVQCNHCGQAHDLTEGEVTHRYADCTTFKAPCCGTHVDDRSWKSFPDFKRL